ncbi:MAG: hypothetical protein AAGK03_03535 [Pseudomonadota bacterium]
MSDPFQSFAKSLTAPPTGGAAVAPSDANDLPVPTRALNVGGAGFVRVTMIDGDVVTLSVAAGVVFPLRAVRIWATGTTATDIVALH